MDSAFSLCGFPDIKDNQIAKSFRLGGNVFFKQNKFFEALENYNKALMFSEPQSIEKSLAFANRSAVYMKVKEYQLCLENIKLAVNSGYPAEKLPMLNLREDKCKKMMESAKDKEDPASFFKLSYPANEKIPFIVNCLELRRNDRFGRHIVATQDFHPGDIIAIEEPLFKTVDDAQHLRCVNCLKSNKMFLIPSDSSSTAMFCSVDCEKSATQKFFQAELDSKMRDMNQRILYEALDICDGSFEKLEQLLKDPKLSRKTIFDFDLSDPTDPLLRYHQLLAFNSLLPGPATVEMEFINDHPVLDLLKTEDERKIAIAFMKRTFRILEYNCIGLNWHTPQRTEHEDAKSEVLRRIEVGSGALLFGSLLNHSCAHNIDRIMFDNKVVFYARMPITKGQQLFISYGPFYAQLPIIDRQEHLKDRYGFNCTCVACDGNESFPYLYDHDWFRFQDKVITEISSTKDLQEEFKKNSELLANTRDDMRSWECLEMMMKNMYLLVLIAKAEPFIF